MRPMMTASNSPVHDTKKFPGKLFQGIFLWNVLDVVFACRSAFAFPTINLA